MTDKTKDYAANQIWWVRDAAKVCRESGYEIQGKACELVSDRLESYEQWFKDNAAVLAAHNIGGYKLSDTP